MSRAYVQVWQRLVVIRVGVVLARLRGGHSNHSMAASRHNSATQLSGSAAAALKPAGNFRFSLRALFLLMLAAAVLSGVVRSFVVRDQAFSQLFVGIGVFCYGGIIALPCYAFVGSLLVLTTTTTRGQRAGEVFAAIVAAAVWISFFVATIGKWPQLCVFYSLAVIAIIVWLVRRNWKIEAGPSPEGTLARLSEAKRTCRHRKTTE